MTDFLVNVLKVTDLGATFNHKVTYHDSCAALREYGIKDEPRELLKHVKGLELINCTFINSPTSDREDILRALKRGNSFGAWIYRPDGETFEKKIERSKNLPAINNIDLRGDDTIFVATTATAKEFRFVGQEGKVLKTTNNSDTAFYVFKTNDTYVRTEIEFQDKTTYYLNPFCRMEGKSPNKALSPEIDIYRTWLLRILGFASLLFIVFNFYHFIWKPRKKTGNN